jgi:glycosyltransferase involved in cell wall biosynthesis
MPKHYSVVFVLPGVATKYPAGGYDIVFRLSNAMNKQGIPTAIVFWSNFLEYIRRYKGQKNKNLSKKVFTLLFYGKKLNYFYTLFRFLNKTIFKVDYEYSLLKNVDCYYYERVEDIKFDTKIIIATAWQTAYFVKSFLQQHPRTKGFYLVQHNEDDPSFSGENSPLAKETYGFALKKIVINKKVLSRFKDENPLFFHVGIDNKFYKITIPLKDRSKVVMFPLRKNPSKGSKYAFECIEKLLRKHRDINVIAFGDYNKKELPEVLKNKIEYYFLPTRKQLRELYNRSMIFVLPSIVEGMSLPPLEAMSCGCAVVVTDNGGVNEYIKDNVNGLLCPIKNADCLYNKIIYLLNNRHKRLQLVNNGLKTAKEYGYENMVRSFTDLITTYL